MQPLDDDELRGLLREWRPPLTPSSLESSVYNMANPPWFKRYLRWLATGSIRVPVPVGLAVAMLLLALAVQAVRAPKPAGGKCVAWAALTSSGCLPAVDSGRARRPS